jgi:tRNA pseudouridine55 synthase
MAFADATGVLLLDKPEGPTSREVLDELEARLRIGALGHCGTLDPLASGLLVVLAGRARRLQQSLMASAKVYDARVRLGATSVTLDREGPVISTGRPVPETSAEALEAVLARFRGDLLQRPPAFAALRVGGRRAHELAREGRHEDLPPRRVRIESVELRGIGLEEFGIRVTCGPGTYIRSLARDLGEALGCGGYLESLRRIRSGAFRVEDAKGVGDLGLADLLPLSEVLRGAPRIDIDAAAAARLARGASIAGELPAGASEAFAWSGDQPLCRVIAAKPGSLRSSLLLG